MLVTNTVDPRRGKHGRWHVGHLHSPCLQPSRCAPSARTGVFAQKRAMGTPNRGTCTAMVGEAESERVRSEQAVWPRVLTSRAALAATSSLAPPSPQDSGAFSESCRLLSRDAGQPKGHQAPARGRSCSQSATLMLRLPVLPAALTVCFSLSEV